MIINSDCWEYIKTLEENSIDHIITDPPYDIGFMNKGWDKNSIVSNPEFWKECLRVLKPGGHLLAFSHSRTSHRQTSAIENAGFEIRDTIMWLYGSGFPKSHNVGKATGKEEWNGWGTALKPAHEPVVMARKPLEGTVVENVEKWGTGAINIDASRIEFDKEDTNPATNPLYRYENKDKYKQVTDHGQKTGENVKFTNSLNPPSQLGRFPANVIVDQEAGKMLGDSNRFFKNIELEPIVIARKPLEGTVADNVEKYGTGAINIDACRIDTTDKSKFPVGEYLTNTAVGNIRDTNRTADPNPNARFPANVIMDEEAGKILDEQSGIRKSGYVAPHHKTKNSSWYGASGEYSTTSTQRDDLVGGASRFFYCPKVSTKERNAGCEELEDKEWVKEGAAIPERDNRPFKPSKNNHPTVKPIKLMEYLIKLVSREGQTILDPFAGSGSTGLACKNLNRKYILIEKSPEYYDIIKARLGEKGDKV